MSHSLAPVYPPSHPLHGRPFIVVHDHDVLNGRGVSIAGHPGNIRFRTLVKTRQDPSYCTEFSTAEKRALAQEIISHIKNLNPPGRFLKRQGQGRSLRGLTGPWEELSHGESIRKVCQALRDANRPDREGYATQVPAPDDVQRTSEERAKSGLSLKEQAAEAIAKTPQSTLYPHAWPLNHPPPHRMNHPPPVYPGSNGKGVAVNAGTLGRVSPSVQDAAAILKHQRTGHVPLFPKNSFPPPRMEGAMATPAPRVPPAAVTASPAPNPPRYGYHGHQGPTDPIPVHPQSAWMMGAPSPAMYHQHPPHGHHMPVAHAPSMVHSQQHHPPYTPGALLTPHEQEEQRKMHLHQTPGGHMGSHHPHYGMGTGQNNYSPAPHAFPHGQHPDRDHQPRNDSKQHPSPHDPQNSPTMLDHYDHAPNDSTSTTNDPDSHDGGPTDVLQSAVDAAADDLSDVHEGDNPFSLLSGDDDDDANDDPLAM